MLPSKREQVAVKVSRSKSGPSFGAHQVGVPSNLDVEPVRRRVKYNQDVHSARNSQKHPEEHDSDVMTEEKFLQVSPNKAAAKRK